MCQQKPLPSRQCLICQKRLIGRSDKVFCSIKCKNAYHVDARKMQRTASSETNKVLAKNYVILAGLMRKNSEKAIISKLALVRAGFSFQYITEVENQKGQLKFGLYDLTYQFIKKNLVLIEVYPNRIEISPFVFERWRRIYRPVHEHLFLRDLSA